MKDVCELASAVWASLGSEVACVREVVVSFIVLSFLESEAAEVSRGVSLSMCHCTLRSVMLLESNLDASVSTL